MGMCKGNRGNLMQHWTLCECLCELENTYKSLHFITTHSMAPWSIAGRKEPEGLCRTTFNRAGTRLANLQQPTAYEVSWARVTGPNGIPYPSSCVIAADTWNGELTCTLCEADFNNANEIDGWLGLPSTQERVQHSVLLRGDWRAAAVSPEFLRSESQCVYLESDPMRYDNRDAANRKSKDPQSMYPEDIDLLGQQVASIDCPLLVHISSFSTQNNIIPLDTQRDSIADRFQPFGIVLHAEVRVNMQMASWVFTRGCNFNRPDLGAEFSTWLDGV